MGINGIQAPTAAVVAGTVLAVSGLSLALLVKGTTSSIGSAPRSALPQAKAMPSPRQTQLPRLSVRDASTLPYPPDLFPGARDVDSPYGHLRCYEWGPVEGKKVVMVPGDTTPAPVFGHLAQALVKKGFRVLVMDTWGRGYSDSPLNIAYDSKLFTMEIMLAIISSPLSWTGESSGGFSIIGFSLGGAITMSFAGHFPYLINSIILLAPGGLIRTLPEGYVSTFFRNRRWVPSNYQRRLVSRVLGTNPSQKSAGASSPTTPPGAEPVSMDNLDLPSLWQWQFDNHQGFVHSFIETTLSGPLQYQHTEWQKAFDMIFGSYSGAVKGAEKPLEGSHGKILVICGESDGVVVADETFEEISKLVPKKDRLVFKTVPGGHGFPFSSAKETIDHIFDFWGIDKL